MIIMMMLMMMIMIIIIIIMIITIAFKGALRYFLQSPHSAAKLSPTPDRLVGLVVRCPPRERKIPGSNPACGGRVREFDYLESYQ